MQQENILEPQNSDAWHFIMKVKPKDTSAEKAIIQEVEREIRIKLEEVTLLSQTVEKNIIQYLFHSKLSDKHVNNIERAEGRILQFFGIHELAKLQVQPSTQSFFHNNISQIQQLSTL